METASDTLTITAISLAPVQRDGYTYVWVGNNVPEHLQQHWVGRAITPARLVALGARQQDGAWVLNYMGRDYLLQTGPRRVEDEVVYNEPRPFPGQTPGSG